VNELLQFVANSVVRLLSDPRAILDIVLIGALIYWVLSILQGTTAMAVLRGIVIVYLLGALLTNVFGLNTLGWLLRNLGTAILLVLLVLFAP
jgi:diadenylate cyclase